MSIIKSPEDYEIIVVDNASSDGSAASVKALFPTVTVIERKVNNGIAGWNDGFEMAKGEYMVVLDDDSNIESGLEDAIAYLDENPDVAILALNIKGGTFKTVEEDGWFDKQNCPGFIGCGAIIRKSLYKQIGGFAEWLFIYTHEFEYGIRCLDTGSKIKYFRNCNVIHRTSVINRTAKRLWVYSIRNEMGIIYKYFPKNRLNFLFRIALNNLKVIKYGEWANAWYTLIGIMKFLEIRNSLSYTPVTPEAQKLFAEKFNTARPAWAFIRRKIVNAFRKKDTVKIKT